MPSYLVRPEVAGELGPDTEMDTSVHPPRVQVLHYVFSGWAGSDIVESFPCFLVSERLAAAISDSELNGFELDDARVSVDEQFSAMFPQQAGELPSWRWFRITGNEGTTDFWQDATAQLHVSDRAMGVLEHFDLAECEFVEVP